MNFIYYIMGLPLGWVMFACYKLVGNYGVALLIFTVLFRLLLFPLTLKQQKSSSKMIMIKPRMEEIQNKYKNNKEKLNEELMKLYQSEGYNPMSGCLPMLIQFPILFGVIDVVYKPLYHILRLPQEIIDIGVEIWQGQTGETVRNGLSMVQLQIINAIKTDPGAYMEMGADAVEKIQHLNLTFLGMNLTEVPNVGMLTQIFSNFNPIVFIPILSGLSALAMSLVSMKMSAASMEGSGAGSMKAMFLIMPIFSLSIAFSVAAGVGLYWVYSNLCGIVQTMVTNKLYNPKEMAEKARIEHEERLEREKQEKREAKKRIKEIAKEKNKDLDDLDDEEVLKALSQKEINRRKLAAARKRDAEKYGEEYVEVTDDDLK